MVKTRTFSQVFSPEELEFNMSNYTTTLPFVWLGGKFSINSWNMEVAQANNSSLLALW